MRKIPFAWIELTFQRVRGLRCTSELPGRPAVSIRLPQSNLCEGERERLHDDRGKGKSRSRPTNIFTVFTAGYWNCSKRNLNAESPKSKKSSSLLPGGVLENLILTTATIK